LAPHYSIKNLAGLAECFGKSQELQERCNFILVTGKLYPDETTKLEEKEIERLTTLCNIHLHGKIRCWECHPGRDLGEAYDRRFQGIFALFPGLKPSVSLFFRSHDFRLSPLNLAAPQNYQNGENGFHINPRTWKKRKILRLYQSVRC